MPAKRKLKSRAVVADLDPDRWRMMLDQEPESPFALFCRITADEWATYRDTVLMEWVRLHPGTRPSHWWRFDAPELRERLGGTGAPLCQVWPAFKLEFRKGIPARWHGVDPGDPPLYESEAAYLKRLELFVRGEETRVPASAFEPLKVSP